MKNRRELFSRRFFIYSEVEYKIKEIVLVVTEMLMLKVRTEVAVRLI